MKKIISILLSVLMLFGLCSSALAAVEFDGSAATVKYNADGSFKILHVNDIQDRDKIDSRTVKFIKKVIETEKPNLAIVPGDNLSEWMGILGTTKKEVKNSIRNICKIFEEADVPFTATFGNHDHDVDDKLTSAEQMEIYRSFSNFVWFEGADPGTFSIPVYSSDGNRIVNNIYIMDSNNKGDKVSVNGYTGLKDYQVEWYRQTSDALAAQNGGERVPSLLFQHVPVKEIYGVLNKVDKSQANVAVYSTDDKNWYTLNSDYVISPADQTTFGEAPCSESLSTNTGEYQAWQEKGDIMCAFFGHDHINNFVVTDENGISMAYTGGSGFAAYGNKAKRTVRIIALNESEPNAFETHSLFYSDVIGSTGVVLSDLFSTAIFGNILRFIYRVFGITSWK